MGGIITAERVGRSLGIVLALSLWATMTAAAMIAVADWSSVFSWLGD